MKNFICMLGAVLLCASSLAVAEEPSGNVTEGGVEESRDPVKLAERDQAADEFLWFAGSMHVGIKVFLILFIIGLLWFLSSREKLEGSWEDSSEGGRSEDKED